MYNTKISMKLQRNITLSPIFTLIMRETAYVSAESKNLMVIGFFFLTFLRVFNILLSEIVEIRYFFLHWHV